MRRLLLLLLLTGCSAASPSYRSFQDVDYRLGKSSAFFGRRAQMDLHYVLLDGPADADPIILLHPWGFNATVWADVAPVLNRRAKIIAMDLPGHGKSSKVTAHVTMKRMAAAVLDVMDDAQIDGAIIVGNSLGGATAVATALADRDRVRGLVLLAAPGAAGLSQVILQTTKQLGTPRQLETASDSVWRVGLAAIPLGDSPTARRLSDDLIALRSAAEWPAWCRATIPILQEVANYQPALESLNMPTLVLHGTRDLVVPQRVSEAYARRLSSARFELLDGCGHMPEVDCASAVTKAIVRFHSR